MDTINSSFIGACRSANIEQVKLLLFDNRFNSSFNTYCIIADVINRGCIELIQILLADPRIDPSDKDNKAIIKASEHCDADIMELLLNDPRVDPNARNRRAIETSVRNGDIKSVQLFMADPRVDFKAIANEIFMHTLSSGACLNIASLFLSDPEISPLLNYDEIIIMACHRGGKEIVKLLLADTRVNPATRHNTPIVKACIRGKLSIVNMLLDDHRVNPSDNNNEAIIVASEIYHMKAIKIMARLIKDVRVDPGTRNNQALMTAGERGNIELLRLLLNDPRINPNISPRQMTRTSGLVEGSIYNNYPRILEMLLMHHLIRFRINEVIRIALLHERRGIIKILSVYVMNRLMIVKQMPLHYDVIGYIIEIWKDIFKKLWDSIKAFGGY